MEISSSSASAFLSPTLLHHHHHHHNASTALPSAFPHRSLRKRRRPPTVGCASKGDAGGWDSGGGLVDENMAVLRRRIHEMRMAEEDRSPPSDWMEWERRYYARYGSDVCELVGLLQTFLMNTRPSLAFGMLAAIALSVPASMILILMSLMEASSSILSGMHLN